MPTYDLGLEHVSLAFATKNIFTDVTQGVFEGDRIGIVGKNGDGKSTLLHLFKGTQEPDSGRVTMRNGLTFGMLDQRDPLDDNATVREAALEGREDYEWAAETKSREIVEALLGGISLDAKIGSLSGGQRRRADLARLLLKDWDILALDEPTNHLDVVTIHWLAEHLKNRWPSGQGALLLVTHDRWFLDEVCESMWEVHDGVIDPFEGGYSAYMLQRVERDRQADVRETKRRNLARKELAWLTRGARARSTKQKFHVKAARELIADVPPVRNTLELKQMATSRLGKQVVDLIDVTQIFEHAQGEADIDPDVAEMEASASRVDVVPAMYAEPQAHGSVEVAVDDLTDPRLVDAGVPEVRQAAQAMADAGVRYAAAPPEWAALLLPLRLPAPVALRRAMLGQLVDCACRQLGLCRSQASVVLRASRPDGAVAEAADLLARRVRYLSPQLGRGQEELRRSLRHRYGLGEGGPAAQLAVCFGAAAEGLPSLLIGESHQEVRYVWAEPWWEKMKPWAAEEPLLAALLAEGSLPPGAAVPVWVGLDTGGERTYNAE